ncbi:hypothetical protein BGY98DRAFT_258873 [Russula aff. rugulosa BPL654]|nr:hypothetical protein BGY98DRAFT_258873 [Russula aff. rugulosa BPL654]
MTFQLYKMGRSSCWATLYVRNSEVSLGPPLRDARCNAHRYHTATERGSIGTRRIGHVPQTEPAAHYVHAGRRTLPSWRGRSSYRQQIDNSTGIQYSAKLFARLFTSIVRLGSPNTVMLPHILMDAINMGIISTPSQLQPNVHGCSSTQGSVVVIIDISGVHKNRCVFSPLFWY